MKKINTIITAVLLFTVISSAQNIAQHLKPGFNAAECDDMLKLSFAFTDTNKNNRFTNFLPGYQFISGRSNIGMENAWALWIKADSTVIITLRGTVKDAKSVLADFYCAMVPAQGHIILGAGDTLQYYLAADKKAAVHAGFLIGFAFLSKDISPILDSLYKAGYHNYFITGHSQGAALCYYVSAWMLYQKKAGVYPQLQVKTYATAPPKMANLYFTYDYNNLTQSVWTFSLINSADPVPEMPLTVQQAKQDVNTPNPLFDIYEKFNEEPFFKRVFLKYAFNRMRRTISRSSRVYRKYLGGYLQYYVDKALPGLVIPAAVNTTYFTRPGVPVVLVADDSYFTYFHTLQENQKYFNHEIVAYRHLLRQYYSVLNTAIAP